jgi:hypothetical protein
MTRNPLDRPRDSPAYRRYVERHPDAAELDSEHFAQHVFHQAQRHLDALRANLEADHLQPTASRRAKPPDEGHPQEPEDDAP